MEYRVNLVSDDPANASAAVRQWWRAVRLLREWTPSLDWVVDPDEVARGEHCRHDARANDS
jgi:hypothetical protein